MMAWDQLASSVVAGLYLVAVILLFVGILQDEEQGDQTGYFIFILLLALIKRCAEEEAIKPTEHAEKETK